MWLMWESIFAKKVVLRVKENVKKFSIAKNS
jgi:hypothetical protein